jgi:hypothetical protein
MTLAEWFVWRRAEDERMMRELQEQTIAHFERQMGAT